jgi:hypothetical protein
LRAFSATGATYHGATEAGLANVARDATGFGVPCGDEGEVSTSGQRQFLTLVSRERIAQKR